MAPILSVGALNGWRRSRPIRPGAPALFLDRDGVIIRDTGYVARPADVALLPGASDAIRTMNRAGWPVIVVSNQSGLGRGYFDAAALEAVQDHVEALLARGGAHLDAVLVCGAAPWETGPAAGWRKPSPGMIRAAEDLFASDLANSIMVGDRATDMIAARDAGVGHRILLGAVGGREAGAETHSAGDLAGATDLILAWTRVAALD